ncbi:UNVERIFIED_CONTAM: hypothetical protein ABIC26_002959 [Paenibacillus sp. PvR008]
MDRLCGPFLTLLQSYDVHWLSNSGLPAVTDHSPGALHINLESNQECTIGTTLAAMSTCTIAMIADIVFPHSHNGLFAISGCALHLFLRSLIFTLLLVVPINLFVNLIGWNLFHQKQPLLSAPHFSSQTMQPSYSLYGNQFVSLKRDSRAAYY